MPNHTTIHHRFCCIFRQISCLLEIQKANYDLPIMFWSKISSSSFTHMWKTNFYLLWYLFHHISCSQSHLPWKIKAHRDRMPPHMRKYRIRPDQALPGSIICTTRWCYYKTFGFPCLFFFPKKAGHFLHPRSNLRGSNKLQLFSRLISY